MRLTEVKPVIRLKEFLEKYGDAHELATMFSIDRSFLMAHQEAEVVSFVVCESPHRKRDSYDAVGDDQWRSERPTVAFVMKARDGKLYGFSDWMREDVQLVLLQIDETRLFYKAVDEKRHPDVARQRLIDAL